MARYSLEIKKSIPSDLLEVASREQTLGRSGASPKRLSGAESPRSLRGVPKKDVARILKAIAALADEPRGPDSEKLSSRDLYRVRQGDYRILYELRDADHTVTVVKVAHRSKAYDS